MQSFRRRRFRHKRSLAGLSSIERNLYEEIVRTTLAMFHTDYLYTETKVTTDVNGLPFFTTGKTERDKGWKALFVRSSKETEKDEPTFPPLTLNKKQLKVISALKKAKHASKTLYRRSTHRHDENLWKACGG